MEQNHIRYHSFLIRLWLDELWEEGQSALLWQGEVSNIQSGQKYSFLGKDDLFRYLKKQLDGDDINEQCP
jgi:hypothetical protein